MSRGRISVGIRKYSHVARTAIKQSIAYRARLSIWAITDVFRLGIFPFVWVAALQGETVGGFDTSGIITYFIGIYLVSSVVYVHGSPYIAQDIRDGKLSSMLIKPLGYLRYMNVLDFVGKNIKQVVLFPIIVIVGFFLREYLFFQGDLSTVFVAILAVISAFFLFMGFSNVFGLVAFWFEDIKGVMHLFWALVIVFSGGLAPLALLPGGFQEAAFWLPFRYFASFPLEIYFGQLDPTQIVQGFAVLFGWTILTRIATRGLWKAGVRRYSAVGM